jgi:putative FmdB family regulatory protein
MPFYEYRCQECGHQFDVLQKISDEPLKDCPDCQKPALVKLVSAPAFRLSGSGWYETDFKTDKDKKKNLAESRGDSGEKKSGSDAGKSETKPAVEKKTDKPKPTAA